MKIGLTGASGFIARHLIRQLAGRGHELVAFSRDAGRRVAGCRETRAFTASQPVDLGDLDAVVNLAGEPILGRWTKEQRRRILESRVGGTERIVQAIYGSPRGEDAGPRVLINGSAIGFYGDRGEEVLEEDDAPGSGFLADVARGWEAAAAPARGAGVRVASVRIGIVLGRDGGTWPFLRRVFRLGLGGRLGDGRQWMSVVHVEDVAGLIVHLLERESEEAAADVEASGAFNAVCPAPVRNADFTRAVAAALHRPALLPAPAALLRRALGDPSHPLLDSQRVLPTRALALGYAFRFPDLGAMLEDLRRG